MSEIIFSDVYKSFGEQAVLSGLSFEVAKGETLCIMGPSGSGKSTIMNLLLGFQLPDSGRVHSPPIASAVFQEDRLCDDFSALSNVKLVNKDKRFCRELLSEMLLDTAKNKPVRAFSGGMKRRVSIARALAATADYYIFDEPFKGLDDETKSYIMHCVKKRLSGKTFILITHDINESRAFDARILDITNKA